MAGAEGLEPSARGFGATVEMPQTLDTIGFVKPFIAILP